MTASGLTITRAWCQSGHRQDRVTQKTLSAFRSNGLGLFRFRTATCCRRAGISVWSATRSAKISMILCMPERVSGGDAEFQGFCDGWNKWEGQSSVDRPLRSTPITALTHYSVASSGPDFAPEQQTQYFHLDQIAFAPPDNSTSGDGCPVTQRIVTRPPEYIDVSNVTSVAPICLMMSRLYRLLGDCTPVLVT